MKKKLTTVLAIVLVVALSVAGTYAYLTSKTATIKNTFTVGKVNITLAETFNTDTNNDNEPDAWQAQLIPGKEYTKDPVVTVKGGSEKCYLFVKFDENGSPADYLTYTSTLTEANGWTKGDGADIPENVWYRVVDKSTTDTTFNLLAGDKVTIKNTVTNDNMAEAAKAELVYTAYACQYEGMTAAEAWTAVKNA